jgi:hypothetical protein
MAAHLRAGAVRDIGGGEVDHQQTTVGVDGDMSDIIAFSSLAV